MDAAEIVRLLEVPTEKRLPFKEKIRAIASTEQLIAALHASVVPLTRQILCDILGERHASESLSVLLDALADASSSVRSAAADALAAIGDVRAGEVLLARYQSEEDRDVRVMLAVALGAVHYQPAVPVLIQALDDPYDTLRIEAAWSLGELHANEAREGMQRVLLSLADGYSKQLVQDALDKLDSLNI